MICTIFEHLAHPLVVQDHHGGRFEHVDPIGQEPSHHWFAIFVLEWNCDIVLTEIAL